MKKFPPLNESIATLEEATLRIKEVTKVIAAIESAEWGNLAGIVRPGRPSGGEESRSMAMNILMGWCLIVLLGVIFYASGVSNAQVKHRDAPVVSVPTSGAAVSPLVPPQKETEAQLLQRLKKEGKLRGSGPQGKGRP